MNAADRREVRALVAAAERSLRAELELALQAYTATLRAELAREVADIDRRISHVHEKALRELTARTNGGGNH